MSRVINGDVTLASDSDETLPEKVRLDVLMTEIFKSYNRSTLQKFIADGYVSVNDEVVKKSNQKFERGVKIILQLPEELRNSDVEPEVIYEDADVLVVNKPCGMLSEKRGQYCPEKTLSDYGFVVHRLDRGTSGVVIIAKNEEVQQFLKKQFKAREVQKVYIAVVKGVLKLEEARIDLPLIRNLKRPTTFLVDANGKPAETYYKVLKTNGIISLVELRPTTGRTHQLRVHLDYLGHPILGDPVYGKDTKTTSGRLYLHAKELTITLPSGEKKKFEAKVPQEFYDVF